MIFPAACNTPKQHVSQVCVMKKNSHAMTELAIKKIIFDNL